MIATPFFKTLQKFCLLFISAAFIGAILLKLTWQYELVPGMASWYMPHGAKLIALFILPFRWWVVFLCGSNFGDSVYFYLSQNEMDISLKNVQSILTFTSCELATGAMVKWLANRFVKGDWFRLRSVMWLIILGIVYRLTYMSIPAVLGTGFFASLPVEKYVEYFIAQQLSGYLVGLYFFSIHLIWLWFRRHPITWNSASTKHLVLSIAACVTVVVSLYQFDPQFAYLLRIAMFIPLVLIATRFGWQGVMLTALVINTGLLMFLYGQDGAVLLEYQPYILSYMLVALLVAGVLYENQLVNRQITQSRDSLAQSNSRLREMTLRLQDMGRNIINIQEKERKHLSQELHDEIGQNIIALKTAIRVLEVRHSEQPTDFTPIKARADDIYHSVYQLMHWLRPIVLDDFGLHRTLSGDYFANKLNDANIEYEVLRCDKCELSATIETAVYRITQEAVTNTIKHANASVFSLDLRVDDSHVSLRLHDDGDKRAPKTTEMSGQFGLLGVRNRVLALNGTCEITDTDGFCIYVTMPLSL